MSRNVLIKPIITEKMSKDAELNNRYGFIVDRNANKVEIKKAVKAMYNVEVTGVNTMNYAGKARRRNTKSAILSGRTSAFKKAVVFVADGDAIDFFADL